jgi:hypothetical protein
LLNNCLQAKESEGLKEGMRGGVFLLLLVAVGPAQAQAQDFTYTNNNGAITITGYTGPGGNVSVPSTIEGLPVTSIGDSAFFESTNIAKVTIPNGVTNIGDHAFNGSSLAVVTVGNGVTTIGSNAFGFCHSLTSVIIPDNVTCIKDGAGWVGGAFTFCTSLTNVTVGRGVTNIGDYAFNSCALLTSLVIPDGVVRIGGQAFAGCTSLTNIMVGKSVTTIADWAFVGCTLTSVTIPNSVTNIGNGVFASCPNLIAITVDPLSTAYTSVDGVLFNKDQTALIACPDAKAGSYTIPNTVANIGTDAFYGCASLTSITIPNSVTNIAVEAFDSCGLTNVTIPDSVSSLGSFLFNGCNYLRGIYFQGNAPSLMWYETPGFLSAYDATVYYLAGTQGWGASFGGSHAALWNPQPQPNDGNFGVRQSHFGFNITGTPDIPIVVEATTNLDAQSWVPLQSCTLTNGLIYFSDAQWRNYSGRLYRIRSP